MADIERDLWEAMTEVEFRALVYSDPNEAVFGFRRLQARVKALREARPSEGAVETAERAAAMAERYVEALEAISEALPNVNRARLVLASLNLPGGGRNAG